MQRLTIRIARLIENASKYCADGFDFDSLSLFRFIQLDSALEIDVL